jgi:hypothetical protein
MSSPRSYPNSVPRDPDTTSVMVAPGPPGPLTTDKHDGTVYDVPLALISTYSTAHILEQINPSINPNNLEDDALVKDLVNCINVGNHDNMNGKSTTTSSASRHLHGLQPNKHSALKAYKPLQQEGDDQLKGVISGVAYTFNSGASIGYSTDIPKFKTVLDDAASSSKPSTSSYQLPDIRDQLHKIPKFQGIHNPAYELAASA